MGDSKYRVLVVDDTEEVCNLLARCVERMGHEAMRAFSAESAWNQAEENAPDVIFLDIMMPEVSGIDLLKRLRADARFAGIPVIMVTALDEAQTVLKCMRSGAAGYVTKPFNVADIRRSLDTLVA